MKDGSENAWVMHVLFLKIKIITVLENNSNNYYYGSKNENVIVCESPLLTKSTVHVLGFISDSFRVWTIYF